jgi:hypothetical protein
MFIVGACITGGTLDHEATFKGQSDESSRARPAKLLFSEWLRFDTVDFRDRFIVDYRVHRHDTMKFLAENSPRFER